MSNKTGAIAVAKRRANRGISSEPVELSTGVTARLIPVSISIITEAQAAVPDPAVPMWYNESKGVEEENPNHPAYEAALKAVEQERSLAAIDAVIMFGVELVDGMPEDNSWIKKLQLRAKLGLSKVDLSSFNLEDEIELEFLYKKYIAVTTADLKPLMDASGLTEAGMELEVAEATNSFPSN